MKIIVSEQLTDTGKRLVEDRKKLEEIALLSFDPLDYGSVAEMIVGVREDMQKHFGGLDYGLILSTGYEHGERLHFNGCAIPLNDVNIQALAKDNGNPLVYIVPKGCFPPEHITIPPLKYEVIN